MEEYKLAPDGKSCLMLSDVCEGPKCLKPDSKFNDTLFGEMLHGYNNRTQHVNQGQVFQMTFRYGADAGTFTVIDGDSQLGKESMGSMDQKPVMLLNTLHGELEVITGYPVRYLFHGR